MIDYPIFGDQILFWAATETDSRYPMVGRICNPPLDIPELQGRMFVIGRNITGAGGHNHIGAGWSMRTASTGRTAVTFKPIPRSQTEAWRLTHLHLRNKDELALQGWLERHARNVRQGVEYRKMDIPSHGMPTLRRGRDWFGLAPEGETGPFESEEAVRAMYAVIYGA